LIKREETHKDCKKEKMYGWKLKNIHSNRLSKKLDQKRYRSFKILKAIGQGVFQLKLLEG